MYETKPITEESTSWRFFQSIPELISGKFRFIRQPNGLLRLEEKPKSEFAGALTLLNFKTAPVSFTRGETRHHSFLGNAGPLPFHETLLFKGRVELEVVSGECVSSQDADIHIISGQYLPGAVVAQMAEGMRAYPPEPISVRGKFAPVCFVRGKDRWDAESLAPPFVELDFWLYEVEGKHICIDDITCVDYAPCPNFPERAQKAG